jgi:hypothetical protein
VTNIVPLNSQTHRSLRVRAEASARLGDNQRFVQVVVNEFPLLVVHYPLLLSKHPETGQFYCGAVLGFDEGENLFLIDGKGHEGYRPLNLQRMPFYAAGSDIAIDLDHPRVSTDEGTALFTESGAPTPYLESMLAAFRELSAGLEMTRVFIETLMKLKLVEPIDMDIRFDDGTRRNITGLYTIAQEALGKLPDSAVLDLFRRGYLKPIYLMIASLKQLPLLAQRKNERLRQ